MRRLFAFVLDMVLIGPLAVLALQLGSGATGRDLLNNHYLWLLTCALIFAFVENSYLGQTPGKFLARLRVVTASGDRPTLFALYLRSTIFLLIPSALALVVTLGAYLLLRESLQYPVEEFMAGWVVLAATFGFAALSGGKQLFHDYVTGTAVIAMSQKVPTRFLSEGAVWFGGIAVVALLAALTILVHGESGLLKRFEKSGWNRDIPEVVAPLSLETSELETGIPDLFQYYADTHGPRVPRPLGLYVEPSDFTNEPLLERLGPSTIVHPYEVHTTLRGIVSSHFQERLAKNVCRGIRKRASTVGCVIEFVYYGSLLDVMFVTVSRTLIVVAVPTKDSSEPLLVTMSPQHGGNVALSNWMPWQLQTRRKSLGR